MKNLTICRNAATSASGEDWPERRVIIGCHRQESRYHRVRKRPPDRQEGLASRQCHSGGLRPVLFEVLEIAEAVVALQRFFKSALKSLADEARELLWAALLGGEKVHKRYALDVERRDATRFGIVVLEGHQLRGREQLVTFAQRGDHFQVALDLFARFAEN